ncbi:Peroxidase [Parasponia andersonii]|uniref:Peroxidase n=1 Tax=Parasponia andersonii TaxID=3476 RepID=A0A2P5D0B8_PARAD|nr:Peroxidase [Parasponia andersonii]
MGRLNLVLVLSLCLSLSLLSYPTSAQLSKNFYSKKCPNVETIVRNAVKKKFDQTFVTVPATIRLFFHDCFVQGCDASVIVASSGRNTAEKDHPDNLSLAGDGFDTVIKAKAAVDATPGCTNQVSCADILALATRDVINLSGGPKYDVELGRFDGLSSTAASVNGKLPKANFNLDQLNAIFTANGLDQTDMIALSAAHTVGFSHCNQFASRVWGSNVDPTINSSYVPQLKAMCPKVVDSRIAINMDPNTPKVFDNVYYKNLVERKGLFTSDQVLFENAKSRPLVTAWANNKAQFEAAFVNAITKLGRVGVKNRSNGNIRRNCAAFN